MPGEKRNSSTPLYGKPGEKTGGKENLSKDHVEGSFRNSAFVSSLFAVKAIVVTNKSDASIFLIWTFLLLISDHSLLITLRRSPSDIIHSVRNDFTGFAIAALIAWKLIVANAMMIASSPAARNIHQLMLMR